MCQRNTQYNARRKCVWELSYWGGTGGNVYFQITYAFVDKTWALFNNLGFIWKWYEIIVVSRPTYLVNMKCLACSCDFTLNEIQTLISFLALTDGT